MFNTNSRCSSLLELSLSRYHTDFHEDLNFVTNFFVMNNEKEQPKPEVKLEPVELLGSLTTYNGVQRGESPGQTVRTSARVFKKMRQDSSQTQHSTSSITPVQDSLEKDRKEIKQDIAEKLEKESGISSSNLSSGIISKQSTNTAKQRMPKALWSTSEKNLFFEALNEYGKDFDSITAYICNKMKKKGVPDNMTKKKHQVSHFYYRTWQKVSKHIKFGDDVKKVVQELYTLINYGEMKKRLVSGVIARAMCRLSELVWHGVVAIRAGGRTVRVRTPICRALRRLNKLEEWEENLRLPSRIAVCLNPRDMEAWSRVHAAAHNPRLLLAAAPSRRIAPVLTSLQRRWLSPTDFVRETLIASDECKNIDVSHSLDQQINSVLNQSSNNVLTLNKINLHSNVLPENYIDLKKDLKNCSSKTDEPSQSQDSNSIKNNSNLSITQDVQINDEFSESIGKSNVEGRTKIDDIVGSSFEVTNKNLELKNKQLRKSEECIDKSSNNKWQIVEESKDLMLYVGPRPGTDINIPTINVSEHLTSQRISLSVYQERLGSGSTCMQTSNNQSNSGIKVGGRLKAKRQRKDSGDNDPLKKQKTDIENSDKNDLNFNIFDIDETANDGMNGVLSENKTNYISKDLLNDEKSNDDRDFNDFGEREFFSEHEYDDKYNETDGECDVAVKSVKSSKGNLKMKTKKEQDIVAGQNRDNPTNDNNEDGKPSNTFSTFFKKNWNRDLLLEKIQKGWSFYDAGDLTFGDLYLMFGVESKLELNYWWAKGTMPLPDNTVNQIKQSIEKSENVCEKLNKDTDHVNNQNVNVEEKIKKCDLDVELLSPNHSDNVETDDSHVLSPDPKSHLFTEDEPNMSSLNLISKIINNPNTSANSSLQSYSESKLSDSPMIVRQRDQVISLTMRLKKLLSLSQLYLKKGSTSCTCGHVCSGTRGKKINPIINPNDITILGTTSDMNVCKFPVFRVPYKHQVNTQNLKNAQIIRLEGSTNQPSTSNLQVQGEDFIPKQIVNFLPKPIVNVLPKQSVNDKHENDVVTSEVFRAPLIKPRGGSGAQLYPSPEALKQKLDFSKLPPWTNRAGKKRKPDIPITARRLIPLAPRPPKIDVQTALKANSTKILTISPKLPQLLPAICVRVVPATDDLSKLTPPVVSDSDNQNSSPEIKKSDVSFVNNNSNEDDKSSVFLSNVSLFGSSSKSNVDWNSDDILDSKEIIQEGGPCLSNLLDISLPSNIGDENSIGVGSIKTQAMYVPSKCDDFSDVALLKTETTNLSIPSMSPSQLLKIENDENWLSTEQDFSLSSFLGHLEGGPIKLETDSSLKDSSNTPNPHIVDLNISSRGTEETVETQFQCLMSETSIDYMAKFADLAAQVAADNTK